jgi:hypothetical protein
MSSPHLLLAVCSGARRGTKLALAAGATATIGRSDKSDLVLADDEKLSPKHFSVQWQGSVATIRDLASANGTLVNGERAATGEARHGSWVRAGETDFTIHIEAHTPPPVPDEPDEIEELFDLKPAIEDDPPAAFATAPPEPGEHMPLPERLLYLQEEEHLRSVRRTEGKLAARARSRREQAAERAIEGLRRIAARGALHAVLDAARSDRILQVLREAVEEHRSLYEGVQGQALDDVAPYLVTLPADSRLLGQLVREGWLHRWGIFLEGAVAKRELRRHLRRFLMVEKEDGEPLYFRFYDPTCLRELWPTCGKRQLTELCGPLAAFLVEGERGELLRLTADGSLVAVDNDETTDGKAP